MKKKYLSQVELAQFCNCSQPYIVKLKKKGLFDAVLDNGKFPKEKATELAKIIEDSKDPTRENQREANKKAKYGEQEVKSLKINEDDITIAPKDIQSSELYNKGNLEKLQSLLSFAKSPNQKVQIIKDFWTGKINEQKFLENEGLLISKEQIIKDNQRILKAFRDKMLALPNKIAGEILGLDDRVEASAIVEKHIYEILEELSSLGDDE